MPWNNIPAPKSVPDATAKRFVSIITVILNSFQDFTKNQKPLVFPSMHIPYAEKDERSRGTTFFYPRNGEGLRFSILRGVYAPFIPLTLAKVFRGDLAGACKERPLPAFSCPACLPPHQKVWCRGRERCLLPTSPAFTPPWRGLRFSNC